MCINFTHMYFMCIFAINKVVNQKFNQKNNRPTLCKILSKMLMVSTTNI